MKSLFLVALLFAPVVVFGQSGNQSMSAVSIVDPAFDAYCLENAMSFMSISEEKRQSLSVDGNLPAIGEGMTYKELGLELQENRTQYFTIEGSQKVLALKSLYVLRLNYANR